MHTNYHGFSARAWGSALLTSILFVCLFPRLGAATIIQTAHFGPLGGTEYGSLANPGASGSWMFDQFDSSLGILQSVEIQIGSHGRLTIQDYNPLSSSFVRTLNGSVITRASIPGQPNFLESNFAPVISESLTHNPGTTVIFAFDFEHIVSTLLTSNLGLFVGSGEVPLSFDSGGVGTSSFGSTSISASFDTRVTYNYTVPDSSNTLVLLSMSAGLLIALRRGLPLMGQILDKVT